eukprot:c1267_g1_i1.p1 GENE.c1267_g1_i1~~c1267_g1_i1.p1  ORF type:complete len:492 (+),score=109.64 c1267_g1_i1:105-1478(+)
MTSRAEQIDIQSVPDELCILVMEMLAKTDTSSFMAVASSCRRFRALSVCDDERLFEIACSSCGQWTPEQRATSGHKKWFLCHARHVKVWKDPVSHTLLHGHRAGVISVHVPEPRRFFSFEKGPQTFDEDVIVSASSSPENHIHVWKRTNNRWDVSSSINLSFLFKSWGSVSFAADNSAVAISQEKAVVVYDLFEKAPRFTVTDATSTVTHLHSDGDVFATASYDCHVRVYNINTGQLLWSSERRDSVVWSVCVNSALGVVVSGYDNGCVMIDSFRISRLAGEPIESRTFGKDANGEVHTDTAISMHILSTDKESPITTVASGSYDCSIRLWNIQTGAQMKVLQKHSTPIMCLSSFHALLASAGRDEHIFLWDTHTGECINQLPIVSWISSVSSHNHNHNNNTNPDLKVLNMRGNRLMFGSLVGIVGVVCAGGVGMGGMGTGVAESSDRASAAQCSVM